jgi:cell division protein FtsB
MPGGADAILRRQNEELQLQLAETAAKMTKYAADNAVLGTELGRLRGEVDEAARQAPAAA